MLDQRIYRLLPFLVIVIILFTGFSLYRPHNQAVSLKDLGDLVPWLSSPTTIIQDDPAPADAIPDKTVDSHPIIDLIRNADTEFNALLAKETFDLPAAAKRYRERRGRHPPPGFDKWWAYARANNATIVEDFWDQIYHDINPLWALDPQEMLGHVRGEPRIFKIRKGRVTHENDHFWMPIWKDMISEIARDLPDMDIAVNGMDEPRLLIPWEDMAGYMEKEAKSRTIPDHNLMNNHFSPFQEPPPDYIPPVYPWNNTLPIFPRVASACPPDSPSRNTPLTTDFSHPPNLTLFHTLPHTTHGYVSNYTLSTSICHQPDLSSLHGFFIEPLSVSTGSTLFPLFGSSKLLQNSEILIPAAMYYQGDTRFTITASPVPWAKKTTSLIWRGLASGGRNKEDNWKGFHRHRLVSMLNGTQAIKMPNSSNFIDIADLPLESYNLSSWTPSPSPSTSNPTIPKSEKMGKWLNSFIDAGFNDLACFPRLAPVPDPIGLTCPYTDYLFSPSSHISLEDQHTHKYLIDVDGNSFSGRYRDFLRSGSLPIKATLFREWHDSRLVPWKHFVPMDNRFLDVYGILEFFVGSEEVEGVARKGEGGEEGGGDGDGSVEEERERLKTETKKVVVDHDKEAVENELRLPPDTAESKSRKKRKVGKEKEKKLDAKYKNGRDVLAKKIALEGRDWAARVLRVEDMRIYTYRVLLEYARVMDEKREMLGWTDDLSGKW